MRSLLPGRKIAPLIVVVEDDEATREVVQIVVENETSYRTLLIPDGRETLLRLEEVAARHIEICWKPFEMQHLLDCIERAIHPPLPG